MKRKRINLNDPFTREVFEHYCRWLNSFDNPDHTYTPEDFAPYSDLVIDNRDWGVVVFNAYDGDDGGAATLVVRHNCDTPREIEGIMQTFDTMSALVYSNQTP